VRDGAKRSRCDWGVDLGRGYRLLVPNLMAYRNVANYMTFQAQDQPPLEAARTGLAIMALGRDLGRHPALIGTMIGIALRTMGVRTIVRALARGLDRPGLEEVLVVLGRFEPIDLHVALVTERVSMEVELARMSGRPLDANAATIEDDLGQSGLVHKLGPVFFDREWTGLIEAMDGMDAILAKPPAERAQAQTELTERLSGYVYASIALPDANQAQSSVDQANVEVSLARVLVAAHLHRLEVGTFPQDVKPLAARLGGVVPADPFAPGKSVQLSAQKDEVRAWSVGPNRVDDHGIGPADRGDIVEVTRIPR
jgi:hypothetical protein